MEEPRIDLDPIRIAASLKRWDEIGFPSTIEADGTRLPYYFPLPDKGPGAERIKQLQDELYERRDEIQKLRSSIDLTRNLAEKVIDPDIKPIVLRSLSTDVDKVNLLIDEIKKIELRMDYLPLRMRNYGHQEISLEDWLLETQRELEKKIYWPPCQPPFGRGFGEPSATDAAEKNSDGKALEASAFVSPFANNGLGKINDEHSFGFAANTETNANANLGPESPRPVREQTASEDKTYNSQKMDMSSKAQDELKDDPKASNDEQKIVLHKESHTSASSWELI